MTRRMAGRRAASAVRGLTALVTLLLLVAGLPAVLYRFGGSPVPGRLPSVHQLSTALLHRDSGSLFLGVVRDVSWVAWALFSLAVITEALAAAAGRQSPRLRLGGLQNMAGQLVALAARPGRHGSRISGAGRELCGRRASRRRSVRQSAGSSAGDEHGFLSSGGRPPG